MTAEKIRRLLDQWGIERDCFKEPKVPSNYRSETVAAIALVEIAAQLAELNERLRNGAVMIEGSVDVAQRQTQHGPVPFAVRVEG